MSLTCVLVRYDDLGEYAGRDVVVVVPRPASVYTLAAVAVVNTITGQVGSGVPLTGDLMMAGAGAGPCYSPVPRV